MRVPPSVLLTPPAVPLLPGSPGTSTRCGCRRPARGSGRSCRSVGTAGRRAGRPGGAGRPDRARPHQPSGGRDGVAQHRRRSPRRRAATATPRRPRAPRPSTCCRCRRRAVDPGAPRRAARSPAPRSRATARARRRTSSASTSWPSRRSSATRASAPARSRARLRASSPRRTSHGSPVRAFPRGSIRQRPVIRRWLRTTTPPSKRSSRFLPTASTDSSTRPSTRGATPVAWARGFGDSTSSLWPTSGCSRRAARWRASPSGTPRA